MALSLKVIVPAGVLALGAVALIVAVNVTAWLKLEGLADDVSEVVVEALFTVSPVVAEFWLKLVSPE